LSNSRLLR